ncbi:Tellurite resistance methyltransferase, TehB, core [Denitrovibrio acetiphilus DSM 12809]|uniref:Tellurite resistance methyltransferase, TehB, core n=1 Tax=Denitrovibrio acetiphilus (strain DSM 12809 / NBRC 114555 / N2460) TaxID=522772 RepID=D4H8L3_DENA2|nr:methyltransferase domain-containing protein [Denitrovibrio acetiphilus]ADD68362.1 Tellurite resistance methyltransferase, TehB, core [Denitrovibrio acetiphilus DSM 12809]
MLRQKTTKFNMAEKWNKRAATYPRFKDETTGFEDSVIEMIQEKGVPLKGKTILDIGCGTGRYTLRLAKIAKDVTGTDISEDMLAIMDADARDEGLSNLKSIRVNWKEYTTDERWDVTFCTITPAVKTPEDFAKMVDYALENVVFLGWHGRVEPEMVMNVYAKFGIAPMKLDFADSFIKWLDENKLNYTHTPMTDEWERHRSIEEMVEKLADEIREYNVEPDNAVIRAELEKYSEDGVNLAYATIVNLGLIIVKK